MKLRFVWKTGHSRLHVQQILASGDPVKIVHAAGAKEPLPPEGVDVEKGKEIEIASSSVAYGAKQRWVVHVAVDDVTGTALELTIMAIYDDTVEPKKTENLCEDEKIESKKPVVKAITKQLDVPMKRPQ